MEFSDEKGSLFVNKLLLMWSALITLDNYNNVLTDFQPFFSLNTLPHTSVGLNGCISIVFFRSEYFAHLTTTGMLPVDSFKTFVCYKQRPISVTYYCHKLYITNNSN